MSFRGLFSPTLIHGRNYIETLLLTFTQYELMNRSLDVMEFIVKRLEEEIVALSYAIPYIRNLYRDYVRNLLEKEFRDLPLPDLDESDYLYDQVLGWMYRHAKQILGSRYNALTESERRNNLRALCVRIVRTALMATLYKCGLVSIK